MSRFRFRIVFILLLIILLVVSALFGVLTYWLDPDAPPSSTPGQGSTQPAEYYLLGQNGSGRTSSS
jgi:hypothetical protein